MIISVAFSAALLAIHGVTGAIIPVNKNAIKRNEAVDANSEAIRVAQNPAVKRTDQDAPTVPISISYGEGSVEQSEVTVKSDNIVIPTIKGLEKRVRYRDGYPDIADVCTVGKHWAQTSNHPQYCTQLETSKAKKNSDPELWFWCYVWTSCDVSNREPTVAENLSASSTASGTNDPIASPPGCHAKAKPFYFANTATCGAELVKGSVSYKYLYPGTPAWSTGVMAECFENAGCEGGLQFGG
ncbi:MAG: hypothetical protein Q9200_005199 [Gallowayella weberi]